MNQKQKDERQTKTCNRINELLRSIAIVSVEGQNWDGNIDKLSDALSLIESDLQNAQKELEILYDYDGE